MKYLWELVDFDTKLFGFKTAKITHVESGSVENLIDELKQSGIQYATFRIPANNFPLIHELERAGFVLVDGILSFEQELTGVSTYHQDKNIREARKTDKEKLRTIAGLIFSLARFYSDPFIPKEKASELYMRWVDNSLLRKIADLVLVYAQKREILGFITLQKKGRVGYIPLVGVAEKSQGKRIARKLITASIIRFKEWKMDKVKVETQMINIAAIRAYLACGFKVVNSYFTFSWSNKKV